MNRGDWIRTRPSRALLWATLVLSLALGVALVVLDRQQAAPSDLSAAPLSDDQAAAQVVGSARQIVVAAQLKDATGGYAFISCAHDDGPPYQAAFYMNFLLPSGDWVRYLGDVASAMIANGWVDAPARAEHFGRKLTRGGVTAVLQRNVDDATHAAVRLYGECRNTGDHRNDNPAWTEVSLPPR